MSSQAIPFQHHTGRLLRRFRNSWEDGREAECDYEVSWWPHGSIWWLCNLLHIPITDSGGCLERSSPQLRQPLGPLLIFYSSPLSVFKLNGNSAVESMLESRGRTLVGQCNGQVRAAELLLKVVNILGSAGHTISVTTTQLCWCLKPQKIVHK